ncbi:MAG TPA: hypothetical protein VIM84_05200 [Gemmatimonadales bacterium]
MANILQELGSTTNFTLTLASLASSATAGRESTAVDNTSNKYLDYICQVSVKLQTGTPASDKAVYIFAYGSVDGTNYTDNATGSDAAITLRDPTALRLVNVIPCPDAGALTYESQPFSIAHAFGGVMPAKFGIVVRNYTGVTLSATESDHFYKYRGVYESVA